MIDSVQLTGDEFDLLIQHYRKGQGLLSQRAHAILLFSSGKSAHEVSQTLFHTEKTVREWIKAFNTARLSSLFPKYFDNQNAAKLTVTQKQQIAQVLASPPSETGIPKSFWDVSSLRDYIVAHFGVVYQSPQTYHFLFKISNFSFKKPAKFDVKRNDLLVKERVEEIRKTITPMLSDPDWVVLVSDESRIVWEAIVRRAWLPKGKKTILKVQRQTEYQNFIGFLNLNTGKPHLYPVPWQNQKEIIKTLKLIKKKYPDKRICLIWDNAAYHKGKLIREELKTSLKSFHLINFAPYAPDTNPQEHIWKYSKDQISNTQFNSMKELIQSFKRIVMGRTYPYQI